MKILQITASYKPAYIYGGPIFSVAKLCEELVRVVDVEDIQVFTTSANGHHELELKTGPVNLIDGVSVSYFKRWTKDHSHFSPGLLLRLRREIHSTPINNTIVHIHGWWNLVSVLSCLIARWYKVPVVLSPRGMLTSYTFDNRNSFSKKLIQKFLGENLLKYCHIHATSEKEKEDILKIVTPKSLTIIPNLVSLLSKDSNKNRLKLSTSSDKPETLLKLIFLSRIEEKKGLELLFEALSDIEIKYKLTIAGSGTSQYIESLKEKAKILQIEQHINWIGQVNNDDKFSLLAQHDLMALISYNENFANTVIESLSVGTPVLLSREVGLASYVEKNSLGWICDLDHGNIKHALLTAKFEAKKRVKIRQTAAEIIRKDFDDESLIKKYLNLYNDVNQIQTCSSTVK
ncbi:glycosyltransferase [Pedobacter aquatilis]|uniref:XrtY-associated glycosyltransferase XYAG1 n=1 Tax=Pedobacter aquatilis TaxID=351343 RepID=UPI0025B32E10|nr:glycosyltransferase [Pedobacter aquatilis]MDN3586187.1 glycosyltransferase [Pedobacter aquatilis]